MQGIAKHLPVLGVILGLATVAPRLAAQETQTRDTSAPVQDTSDLENPPGYRGMERSSQDTSAGASGDTLTGGAIDSTGTLPADTGARRGDRLRPTDTTGTSRSGDTGSVDSAAVKPGSTEPLKTEEPTDRLSPTDSAGADTSSSQAP